LKSAASAAVGWHCPCCSYSRRGRTESSCELEPRVVPVTRHCSCCRHSGGARIYADVPTDLNMSACGEVSMSRPANLLIRWATARAENPVGESTLAIRWGSNGRRLFVSGGERFAVDDATYLVFNHGRRFSSTIDSPTPVDCCTICFQPQFADDTLRALVTPDDRLLDEPHAAGWTSGPEFLERATPHDAVVSPVLHLLERQCDSEAATRGWFEEHFSAALVGLLQAHRNVFREMERVPAARPSTRAEIYVRLQRARDFMEASLFEPLTIPDIAAAAWFSPHHFLRLFKQTFGQTPHQYLTRRRLEHARRLLSASEISVTEVCSTVGFESLGSFSLLFRRHVGQSPEAWRFAERSRIFTAATSRARFTDTAQSPQPQD
jgi:AraC family transcriptional regulator